MKKIRLKKWYEKEFKKTSQRWDIYDEVFSLPDEIFVKVMDGKVEWKKEWGIRMFNSLKKEKRKNEFIFKKFKELNLDSKRKSYATEMNGKIIILGIEKTASKLIIKGYRKGKETKLSKKEKKELKEEYYNPPQELDIDEVLKALKKAEKEMALIKKQKKKGSKV